MLYRFTAVTDEVDDFLREFVIDSEATFLQLNKVILASCGYPDDQMTSFYICDDDWEKQAEVTREDMGASPADEDILVMADTHLDSLIEDEGQKIKFIFDPFNERALYLQLKETILHKDLKQPECTRSRGNAPKQIILPDTKGKGKQTGDDDLFGDDIFDDSDGFNDDDIDYDGFQISDDGQDL